MNSQTEKHLPQHVAVVTGGAGGIGTAVVLSLLARGDRVVATDVSYEALYAMKERVAAQSDQPADVPQSDLTGLHLVVADVRAEGDWLRLRDEVAEIFGAPNILVNNAGISPKLDGRKLYGTNISLDEWQAVVDVNLTGAFLGIKTLAPGMIEQGYGRIINMASVAARSGGRLGGVHYAATKTGMLGLTRSFAQELAIDGITVNAVAPGRIDAGMASMVGKEVNTEYASSIPVGRLGEASDIARTVLFLTDHGSSFVTGTTSDVNGGSHMQ